MPDGRKRSMFFTKGKATAADLSQADSRTTFRASKRADFFTNEAGHERCEIPEAVVSGGQGGAGQRLTGLVRLVHSPWVAASARARCLAADTEASRAATVRLRVP
jgi:hypothetical protein